MTTSLNSLDQYINNADWLVSREQPVAIELTEMLEPAAGPNGVVFPPTYARDQKAAGIDHPYAIDVLIRDLSPADAGDKLANICTLDSVGSQANRMEPIFSQEPLSKLVPQVTLSVGDETVSLLALGHRLADGTLRFSDLADSAAQAIAAWAKNGNAQPIAKLAPTSLVFGFWDSRDSGLKVGRVVASTIRATNVSTLKRSAQFTASKAVRVQLEQADASDELSLADNKGALSEAGMLDAPSVDTHGGVIVHGSIIRRTEINLVALRALMVRTEQGIHAEHTLALRRYILALALVAATAQSSYDLRQGCLLVRKKGEPATPILVLPDGKREAFTFTFKEAFELATNAAAAFEVGKDKSGGFEVARVKQGIQKKADDKVAKAAKKAAKKTAKKSADEVSTEEG